MSSDDQFTATLGTALHAELADLHVAPGFPAAVRRRRIRQTRALQATVAAPMLAAVAVVGAGAIGAGAPERSTTPPSTADSGFRSVAYVTAHADTALASASGYVLRTTSQEGLTSWTDPVTGRSRTDNAGSPATSSLRTGRPAQGQSVLTVDHASRTWWKLELPPRPAGTAPGLDAYTDPQQIRTALSTGALQVIGDDRDGGAAGAIHLRLAGNPRIDLWVDGSSYLPVRLVGTKGQVTSALDFSWLPRTAENVAKTELTPPAGYTQRAMPRGQAAPAGSPR